ncbi:MULTISPECIES: hypothetical protein [Nocardioides]|uniref:hypothetical protein n=1 Tax=Nocardioides TaxID=1839 RepID=UPI001315ACB9|nr:MULTISPECIES: hypothetical protein [Nocardioides]
MDSVSATVTGRAARPRRVRDQAREVLAVMTFSAGASAALALALLILTSLGK